MPTNPYPANRRNIARLVYPVGESDVTLANGAMISSLTLRSPTERSESEAAWWLATPLLPFNIG